MSKTRKAIKARPRHRREPIPANNAATVLWPGELAARWGLSRPTLWRYARDGKLPPRDFAIGDRRGWRRSTIEQHEAAGGAP